MHSNSFSIILEHTLLQKICVIMLSVISYVLQNTQQVCTRVTTSDIFLLAWLQGTVEKWMTMTTAWPRHLRSGITSSLCHMWKNLGNILCQRGTTQSYSKHTTHVWYSIFPLALHIWQKGLVIPLLRCLGHIVVIVTQFSAVSWSHANKKMSLVVTL